MQVRNPTTGRNTCPVKKSNQSNNVRPKNDRPSTAPNDNEQKAPMIQVEMVTISAAFLRVTTNSSCKNAVETSCSEISDVSAANDSSRKKSREMM